MSRIDVRTDGDKCKIMVNFILRNTYSSVALANNEAKKLHEKELPHAELNLAIA